MSSIKILSVDSQCSPPPIESSVPLFPINDARRHSVPTTNASQINSNIEQFPLKNRKKQTTFEVKTNIFKRNVQVKTKQEDTICTTNKSSISTSTQSSSSHCSQIQQPPKSSISNSFIQNVRVSVSSSPYEKDFISKIEAQSPVYSSMMSNFIRENLNEEKKFENEEETFNHRPLLDLINELNQRNTSTHSPYVPNINDHTKPLSPLPLRILPPKQFPPFKPVIVHRKYQEPIGHFNFMNNNEDSSLINSSFSRRNSRNGVMRSHTFTASNDIDSNSNQTSSNNTTTCQSTPELTSSNQSATSTIVNAEHNSPLSTSASSLTGLSNANATPTSSGSIDDKNEVDIAYFSFS